MGILTMHENKILFKNTLIYTLGGIGAKALSYLLIPLYTYCMVPSDYGLADIFYLTVQIGVTVGTLKIASSLVRFTLENKDKFQTYFVCSIGVILLATIVITIFYYVLCNRYFIQFNIKWYYFLMLFLTTGFRELCSELTKALDKNVIYVTDGIVYSVVLFFMNIIFLWVFRLGICGYIVSFLFANSASIIFTCHASGCLETISFKNFNKNVLYQMISYSIYLAPAAASFWIIQASDRYMVNAMLGSAYAGLYAAAYKIPSICGIFVNFFISAWYISAVHQKDNTKYYSKVFDAYSGFVFLVTGVVIISSKFIAVFMFQGEFFAAWKYLPFLIYASAFSYFYSYLEIIFVTIKASKAIMWTSLAGATVNLIFNYILINAIGIYGAILSTLISYLLIFKLRLGLLQKNNILKISKYRIFINSIVLFITAVLSTCFNGYYRFILPVLFLILIFINKNSILMLIKIIRNR